MLIILKYDIYFAALYDTCSLYTSLDLLFMYTSNAQVDPFLTNLKEIIYLIAKGNFISDLTLSQPIRTLKLPSQHTMGPMMINVSDVDQTLHRLCAILSCVVFWGRYACYCLVRCDELPFLSKLFFTCVHRHQWDLQDLELCGPHDVHITLAQCRASFTVTGETFI